MIKIYVDGSYHNGGVGYGVVVISNDDEVITERSGAVPAEKVDSTRQVAGELYAVGWALEYCKKENISEVKIYYDYNGVEKWATGAWKANLELTQKYAAYVNSSGIRILWNKVEAHSGDVWNDRADLLAKKGAETAVGMLKKNQKTTSTPKTSTRPDAKVIAAEKMARSFGNFLAKKNISTCFDQVYNSMYARLIIKINDENSYFDLYNTFKKPFSPYLHNFKDTDMKLRIQRFWNEFKSGEI